MIEALIINSFICIGFNIATEPGMILNWIEKLLEKAPLWLQKPIYLCPMCMASVHSLWVFPTLDLPWHYWFGYTLALCGINALTYGFVSSIREN